MPSFSELRSRRGLLLSTASVLALTSCESDDKPELIAAPKPKNALPVAIATKTPEPSPTPEPKGLMWSTEVLGKSSPTISLSSIESELLKLPSFLVDEKGLYVRLKDGTIVEADPKSGREVFSTKEQGVLLHLTPENVVFMRTDLRLYKLDRATKQVSLLARTPDINNNYFIPGSEKEYYRFPIATAGKFVVIPFDYQHFDQGGYHTYSLDGDYKQTVSPNFFLGIRNNLFIDAMLKGQSTMGGSVAQEVCVRDWKGTLVFTYKNSNGLPLLSSESPHLADVVATSKGFQHVVYSLESFKPVTTTSIPTSGLYDRVKPIFLNSRAVVFEKMVQGVFTYDIASWPSDGYSRTQQKYPSRFFSNNGERLYHSTPALGELLALGTDKLNLEASNDDVKAVSFLGETKIGGNRALLFGNWKTGDTKKSLFPLSKEEKYKVYALDAVNLKTIWTYVAPSGFNDGSPGDCVPLVRIIGEKLLIAAVRGELVELATGKVVSIPRYNAINSIGKDDSGIVAVNSVGNQYYVQSMKNLYVYKA